MATIYLLTIWLIPAIIAHGVTRDDNLDVPEYPMFLFLWYVWPLVAVVVLTYGLINIVIIPAIMFFVRMVQHLYGLYHDWKSYE